jgi:hypothetical protein
MPTCPTSVSATVIAGPHHPGAELSLIEACTDTHVNAAQCDALVNFYRTLREEEH